LPTWSTAPRSPMRDGLGPGQLLAFHPDAHPALRQALTRRALEGIRHRPLDYDERRLLARAREAEAAVARAGWWN
jgi:hypothetical protein